MKRDLNLFRLMLLALESHEEDGLHRFEIEGYDQRAIALHQRLLEQAGLIERIELSGQTPIRFVGLSSIQITNAGYDFLENARNPSTWRRALETLAKHGVSSALDFVRQVLARYAAEEMRKVLP